MPPVRFPGAKAVAGMRNAAVNGISPDKDSMNELTRWAEKLGLLIPDEAAHQNEMMSPVVTE
jgi:LDH2 family malate/lactate/ureidoglycolate dehydrogenase